LFTGADPVFRSRDLGDDPDDPTLRLVLPLARENGGDPISVEREVLRPVVAGSNDLHRFRAKPSHQWVILPYEPDGAGRYRALSVSAFERRFPRAAAWLRENEGLLRQRSGEWNDEDWILYSRRQNLEKFAESKVLVPYMVKELTAAVDESGAYFVNVTTGGYGLGLAEEYGVSREYLAALLNSELLSWALKRYSRAWRGDYYGARKRNLVRLPIASPEDATQAAVVDSFEHCVAAATAFDAARSGFDQETLGRAYENAVEQFDRVIFDLYEITPEELLLIRSS
jgi:TaqI-like C-terminal specificity domain